MYNAGMANELEDTTFLASKEAIINAKQSNMVRDAIEIGLHLTETRDYLKHITGGFEQWVRNKFGWSRQWAYSLITIYETYGRNGLVNYNLQLPITALLTIAKEDEPVRKEILDKAKDTRLTQKEVEELIKEAKAEAKKAAEADEEMAAKKALKNLKKEHKDLSDHANLLAKNVTSLANDKRELTAQLKAALSKGKSTPEFGAQLEKIISELGLILQNDQLARMLRDLIAIKEHIELDNDFVTLSRLLLGLSSISERAKLWAEQVTPTNDRWNYFNQQHDGE